MPAELTSSDQAPGIGSSTSSTAPSAWLIASQSCDGDLGAVGAVGHHLHGGAVAAEHGDAHEFEAHGFERGRDDGGQPGLQAGVASVVQIMQVRLVQSKKGGPLRPPSVTQRRMICAGQIAGLGRVCKIARTGSRPPINGRLVNCAAAQGRLAVPPAHKVASRGKLSPSDAGSRQDRHAVDVHAAGGACAEGEHRAALAV